MLFETSCKYSFLNLMCYVDLRIDLSLSQGLGKGLFSNLHNTLNLEKSIYNSFRKAFYLHTINIKYKNIAINVKSERCVYIFLFTYLLKELVNFYKKIF